MTLTREQYHANLFSLVGYTPTAAQQPILSCSKRFILVAGGEQAGKSLTASKYLFSRAFDVDGEALYWLVAADYDRTRAEFDYLIDDFTRVFGARNVKATKIVNPGRIVVGDPNDKNWRIVIETKSSKDPTTLAMRSPHGILICEASQVDLETYNRLSTRVGSSRGWMMMTGTYESSLGWYPGLAKAWEIGTPTSQSFKLPSPSNTYVYPGGVDDPEILRMRQDISDEFFMERIMGEARPPAGLVFHEFRADLHTADIHYIPNEPVHIWLDPGYDNESALLAVQIIDGTVHVFDEIYTRELVTSEVIHTARQRPWWQDVTYGTVDIAGRQHHAMPAVVEVWLEEANLRLTSNKVGINEGIERLRTFLRPNPLTHRSGVLISPYCKGLLSELGGCLHPMTNQMAVYSWSTDNDGNTVGDTPRDRHNHSIKALIYGLVGWFGHVTVSSGRDTITVRHRNRERKAMTLHGR
jgi:hypothetical protein